MAVIDTSWLLRLLDADDPLHTRTRGQLEAESQVTVAPVTVAETMFVLERAQSGGTRAGRRQAAAAVLGAFLSSSNLVVRESMDAQAAVALTHSNPKLSFPDAVALVTAKELRQELWTFDADQQRAFESL